MFLKGTKCYPQNWFLKHSVTSFPRVYPRKCSKEWGSNGSRGQVAGKISLGGSHTVYFSLKIHNMYYCMNNSAIKQIINFVYSIFSQI